MTAGTATELPERRPPSEPPADPSTRAAADPAVTRRATLAARHRPALVAAGVSVSLLAVLLGGFLGYLFGLSGAQERHTQDNLAHTFAGELAAGVAPTGPAAAGDPVAVLEVPALRLRQVVVEGTTAETLTEGPGHRPDTVLPGQVGISVLMGRRTSYGGPFRNLDHLRPGEVIRTVTGQGTATYRVVSVGPATAPVRIVPGEALNRLELLTSNPPYLARSTVLATARLVSPAYPAPTARPGITATEKPLAGDASATVPLLLWCQLLLAVVVATCWAAMRWSRLLAVLAGAPVLAAVLWNAFEAVARLLPNLL